MRGPIDRWLGAPAAGIPRYGLDGFAALRRAGRLAATTLDHIAPLIRPGVTTATLDEACALLIRHHGGIPAAQGYRGYPRATCISVNEEVCHGVPGARHLQTGDILNIDVTVRLDGWYGDTSRMFFVGEPAAAARRLCQVTFEAMWRGIRAVRPGARLGAVGHAIQAYAEAHGCTVVRDYCGHGIGRAFHQPPTVLHFGAATEGAVLAPGMVFTVEPMINAGGPATELLADRWTVVTADRALSAQFEHTVGVTASGVEVFTRSPAGLDHPPW
jgi:methionyl aminopeptidase